MRKLNIDWTAIDWSKTTKEIANTLCVSKSVVSFWRKKIAPMTLRKIYDWRNIDWSKTTAQIARDLKTSFAVVAYNRRKYAIETVRNKIDWCTVDWSKDNYTLSKELNRSYHTICQQRVVLGKTGLAKTKKIRSDKGAKKPQMAFGVINQPLATAAAKQSLKAGKFETNIHAKHWRLTRDDGAFWEFDNLYHFVRTHTELFLPQDVKWKRQGGKRGTGGEYCNATAGLLNTASGRQKKWKGWILKKK